MAATYSWKKALAHAGIAAVVVVAAGAALVATHRASDSERFGEGVGRFAAFVGLASYGISYLLQTGRRAAGLGVLITLVAAIAGLGVVVYLSSPRFALTAADRAPLVVDGDRLRHPTLGFSIHNPGASFQPAPQWAEMISPIGDGPEGTYDCYVNAGMPPSVVLVVTVFPSQGALAPISIGSSADYASPWQSRAWTRARWTSMRPLTRAACTSQLPTRIFARTPTRAKCLAAVGSS
jgi:hypothetical protein